MGASPSFPVVDLRGRSAVVTGANTGIGYETAKHLAMMGASVVMACRSEQRARDAITRMKEEVTEFQDSEKGYVVTSPDDLAVEFMPLDLSSLQSTMEFIKAFKSSGRQLHLLLCNAGLGLGPRVVTGDGFEQTFQVNYLSQFLVVAHLVEVMKRSGEDCRIIFTSSVAHTWAGYDLEAVLSSDAAQYGRTKFYANSKLYQIQHMYCLGRRLAGSNVAVTSMHPGAVKTEFTRNAQDSCCMACGLGCVMCLAGRTPLQGAVTLIDLAVNPKYRGVSNLYHVDCKAVRPSADARNEDHQEELWRRSKDCLKDYLPDDVIASLEK